MALPRRALSLVMPLLLCSTWLITSPCAAVVRRCRYQPKLVVVGGAQGWRLGVNSAWVGRPTVYTGDRLRFQWPAGQQHSVLAMSAAAYQSCNVTSQRLLATSNYTTGPLQRSGIFYFACGVGNGGHCSAGQKVIINVRRAPTFVSCSPPPPPRRPPPPSPSPPPPPLPMTVKVGNDPSFWTFGVNSWVQPRVKTGDTLLFTWAGMTTHNVFKILSRSALESCSFSGASRVGPDGRSGNITYTVTEPAGAALYFACTIGFHCGGGMKVAISIT